jgi:hypothetical protein
MINAFNKYSAVLQAALIVLVINGLFLYIYLRSGYVGMNCWGNGDSFTTLSIREKQSNVIYYKTHKTASTTLGSIIFRFGAQHGLRFHNVHNHYKVFSNNSQAEPQANISLFHHVPEHFDFMMAHYRSIIPNGKFLSILREPVRRYLSSFHYYNQPVNHAFHDFLTWKEYNNRMVLDFGVFNKTDLDIFMQQYYSQFFFLITEKLDESLVLLKRTWHWDLEDILYLKLNDGCAAGFRDFDRKPMRCVPSADNLTQNELQQMRDNNQLDLALYERALGDFNRKLEAQPESFWEELKLFKKIRLDLQSMCTKDTTIPSCQPFLWMDLEYESKMNNDGFVVDYPRAQFGYQHVL